VVCGGDGEGGGGEGLCDGADGGETYWNVTFLFFTKNS